MTHGLALGLYLAAPFLVLGMIASFPIPHGACPARRLGHHKHTDIGTGSKRYGFLRLVAVRLLLDSRLKAASTVPANDTPLTSLHKSLQTILERVLSREFSTIRPSTANLS